MARTTVYRCTDGTDFPVSWEDEADADQTWRHETEHFAEPYVPLEEALFAQEFAGIGRAFAEFGLPPSPIEQAQVRFQNGFAYWSTPVENSAERTVRFAALDKFADGPGSARGVWEEIAFPRVRQVVGRISEMDDATDPRLIYREMCYGWGFCQLSQVARYAVTLSQFCQEHLGDEGSAFGAELTQGYSNTSIEADEAVWQLGQQIKASANLRQAINADGADMVGLQADAEFWASFQDYLDRHGGRSLRWQLHAPTWRERPESILQVAAHLADSNSPSPMQLTEAAAALRESRLADLEQRLAGTPDLVERLHSLYIRAAEYGPVREAKAYWQLLLWGAARQALLRIGDRLVREGRVDQAEDILYLTTDEIGGAGDMREVVSRQRQLRQERLRLTPPPEIGGENEKASSSAEPPPDANPQTEALKGSAASRGTLTATARVINDPAEAGRLGPGEVLVCVLTSPSWTSMFAVAGALVTEGGGLLSHPAIVAREYGIPCVVGVRGATQLIRDGQLITVDGTNGEVRFAS